MDEVTQHVEVGLTWGVMKDGCVFFFLEAIPTNLCIKNKYGQPTKRWDLESTRLTLLWLQRATGDYFEEDSALSIRFLFEIVTEDKLKCKTTC